MTDDGVQYLTVDKKQLEYMRVVNLSDVRRQSQLKDRELLKKMQEALIKEQIERKKRKEKVEVEDEQ